MSSLLTSALVCRTAICTRTRTNSLSPKGDVMCITYAFRINPQSLHNVSGAWASPEHFPGSDRIVEPKSYCHFCAKLIKRGFFSQIADFKDEIKGTFSEPK